MSTISTADTEKLSTVSSGSGSGSSKRVKVQQKRVANHRSKMSDSSEESDQEVDRDTSDSDSDCMMAVRKPKKVSNRSDPSIAESDMSKETLPVSPEPSASENEPDSEDSDSRASSPETPEGQWEIEEILNYVRDDFGEMYYVKWKDWTEDFNTWEPPSNLLNCEQELLRFYLKRKREYKTALDQSEYIEMPNGKRRRKGPGLPDVPPDPRPFDIRVQEFFTVTKCSLDDDEVFKVFSQWKSKQVNAKSRWPEQKVNKYLEDGVEGKLLKSDIDALKRELILIEVEKKNKELSTEIKNWEKKINRITGNRPHITIENDVDMSGPPIGFEFVNDYIEGEGVVIPTDPPVGCGCAKGSNCYDERNNCCAMQFGYKFAYTRYRKVTLLQGSPIYECNSKCRCDKDCPNRVVQDGKSDHKLSIFRTSNGCGWGVKTLKPIKKGSFVTLYVGEVIKLEEAERRGRLYDETGCTYLFDLDFNDPDNPPFSVDASKYGNVAHFINHSCMPNLGIYCVWVDCLDPNLPKLAMFALRDIGKNEELTFDYSRQLNSTKSRSKTNQEEEEDTRPLNKRTQCLCGTAKCRKYIF